MIDPLEEHFNRERLRNALDQAAPSERALSWIGASKTGKVRITKGSFEWYEDAHVEVEVDLGVYGVWPVGFMAKKDLEKLIK